MASRLIGRIGSMLVEIGADQDESHRQLIRDNPGVFAEQLEDRIPTSIDMLEPESCILAAMRQLPRSRTVHFHSIIGVKKDTTGDGPGDGVVSAASASFPGVETELKVNASHEEIHHQDASVREIACILKRHLDDAAPACSDCTAVRRPLVRVVE